MASTVKELRTWLDQFEPDELIGVDDGGLMLQVIDDEPYGLKIQPYFEIGGISEGTPCLDKLDETE
jgi:hypothetical protein